MRDFLARLRDANVRRCEKRFHPLADWSETDWGCGLAGETGELCELLKKRRRGENVSISDVGKEIADVIIYADLLAARLSLDLRQIIQDKFNEVSMRVKSDVFLWSDDALKLKRTRRRERR